MRKYIIVSLIIIAIVLLGLGVMWKNMNSSSSNAGAQAPITIGDTPYEYSGLIYIAENKGFFSENGLNITDRDYSSGPETIRGLLDNETNIGLASEYAFVQNQFGNENLQIIGTIDTYNEIYIIGRRDKGIENVSDLKGKIIGTTLGGSGEFYLGRFLELNGLTIKDVILVDLLPSQY